jgi:hypothetical protein
MKQAGGQNRKKTEQAGSGRAFSPKSQKCTTMKRNLLKTTKQYQIRPIKKARSGVAIAKAHTNLRTDD